MARDTEGFPSEANRSGDKYYYAGERWYLCDYCGWMFPKSQTRVETHTGRRACITGPNDYNSPSEDDETLQKRRLQLLFIEPEEQTT